MSAVSAIDDVGQEALGGWLRRDVVSRSAITSDLRPPTLMRVPLHRILGVGRVVRATRPLVVTIQKGEDLYLAEAEVLGVFASGESVGDAMRDLSEQLLYFYDLYTSSSADQLTGQALELKRIYSAGFEQVISL